MGARCTPRVIARSGEPVRDAAGAGGLTNVLRHTDARSVLIEMVQDSAQVRISLGDDGAPEGNGSVRGSACDRCASEPRDSAANSACARPPRAAGSSSAPHRSTTPLNSCRSSPNRIASTLAPISGQLNRGEPQRGGHHQEVHPRGEGELPAGDGQGVHGSASSPAVPIRKLSSGLRGLPEHEHVTST